MKVAIVIPARLKSSRLPEKVLTTIGDKTMVQHVYDRATLSRLATKVMIATDDKKIYDACAQFGVEALMTSPHHTTGTDRVIEAALHLSDFDYIINLQADEPLIDPKLIDDFILFILEKKPQIATLSNYIEEESELFDYNVVKLVCDHAQRALYFSRQAIPALRDVPYKAWLNTHIYLKHIGMYAFSLEVLRDLKQIPPSSLEMAESLEQLRWLQQGYQIHVMHTDKKFYSVDTISDLEKVRALMVNNPY